jgi:hypothetical protein
VARCYGQCALADVRPTLRPRQSKGSPPARGGGVPVASKYQPACAPQSSDRKTLDVDMRHSAATRSKRFLQDQPLPTVGEQESSRLGSRAAAAHWSYDGATGPEKWGIFDAASKIFDGQSAIVHASTSCFGGRPMRGQASARCKDRRAERPSGRMAGTFRQHRAKRQQAERLILIAGTLDTIARQAICLVFGETASPRNTSTA